MTNSPVLYNMVKVVHIQTVGAVTATGQSSSTDMQAVAQVGACGRGLLIINAGAKSGTFTQFDLRLQGSPDNSVWTEVAVIKNAADAPAANTDTIYDFNTELGLNVSNVEYRYLRVQWVIAGTTPSLSFSACMLLGGFEHLSAN